MIQLRDSKWPRWRPDNTVKKSVPFNLQNGTGHLLGCYGEGEGKVDGWNTVMFNCAYLWKRMQLKKKKKSFCMCRCGTTFARTEAEAATTPDWRTTEGAPSGTTRKRWAEAQTQTQHWRDIIPRHVSWTLNSCRIPFPFPLITAPVGNWGASQVHHHPVWARHQSACGWLWRKGHLWSAQGDGRYVLKSDWWPCTSMLYKV